MGRCGAALKERPMGCERACVKGSRARRQGRIDDRTWEGLCGVEGKGTIQCGQAAKSAWRLHTTKCQQVGRYGSEGMKMAIGTRYRSTV